MRWSLVAPNCKAVQAGGQGAGQKVQQVVPVDMVKEDVLHFHACGGVLSSILGERNTPSSLEEEDGGKNR